MITPEYVRTMAAYNAEMNRRIYDAAARLSDEERRKDRGAFWGSIHRTLNHILWGDTIWMTRFDNWEKPGSIKESDGLYQDFSALRDARVVADRRLCDWAERVDAAWLADELTWFSAVMNKEMRKSHGLLVTHIFNHQTHHRGQVHAMLTAAGEKTGDTDLPFVI